MIEAAVESYFKRRVKETGGEERKVVFPGRKGAPDRLCGWPNGRHGFVELKRPKGKAEAHQAREHERLRAIGFRVDLIDTREAVEEYVKGMAPMETYYRDSCTCGALFDPINVIEIEHTHGCVALRRR